MIEKLQVRNGSTTTHGGGILVGNADLTVRDTIISGNRASQSGGGISNGAATGTGNVTLVRTTISRNVAGTSGGGVFSANNVLTVQDSTVRRNLTTDSGGGISATTANLTNCTISGNAANNGGGISAGTAVTLTNCTVSGNSAGSRGGGIDAFIATATLIRSTLSGNTAGTDGGGLFTSDPATLSNCTVSGNTAGFAGGGINATGATLLNCSIVENIAPTGGGVFHQPGDLFRVKNTIIALNLVDVTGDGPDLSGSFTSDGHNLIGVSNGGFINGVNGDIVGTAANPIDPKLSPLANNGGKTKTHALLAGSPAIDKGDNANVSATDQRGVGFARKKDGNGDGLAIVDIGAFER